MQDNPQSQTDPTVQAGQTLAGDPPVIPEDAVKNHPLYKELEEKSAVAEREAKRYKGRLAKANIKEDDEPVYVTKEELEQKAWEIAHSKDIEVYADDEYKSDIKQGIPRDKALQYAKLRYSAKDNSAHKERLMSASSGSSVDRSLAPPDEIILTQEQKDRGITVEMIKKYRDME